MKRVAIIAPLSLAMEERPDPTPMDDEILIRVRSLSICGSDIHLFHGTYNGPKNYPIMFGHEWSGEVVDCGGDVRKVKKGDRVTGDCSRFCGTCEYCRSDKNVCEHIEKFGITIDGASAETILRKEKYIYRLPKSLDFSLGSLVEPLAVSANLLARIAKIEKNLANKRILICGAAGIGLGAFLQLRHRYGCGDVTVLEISDFRRRVAESLGARTIDSLEVGTEDDGYASLYSKDNYDVIIESTGNADVFAKVFERVKPLGIIGTLGMLSEVAFAQKLIVLKALTVVGSIGGTGHFEEVIDFIDHNHECVGALVSHRFRFSDTDSLKKGFEAAANSKSSVKVQFEV